MFDYKLKICLCGKPTLSFMDGIVGMEGHGLSAGESRKIGAVIASPSPYHLDVIATSIINLKPIEVPTIKRCVERNICTGTLEDIQIIGEDISKFILKDFVIPDIRTIKLASDWMPQSVRAFIDNMTRPRPTFNHDECIGCKDCEEACPLKVITMKNNRPVANLEGCIRCFVVKSYVLKKLLIYIDPGY